MKNLFTLLLMFLPMVGWAQTNANNNDVSKNKEGWRLEFPHFYEGTNKTFEITKSTSQYGITYSLEWDGTLKANRWTCYELHAGNMLSGATRQDDYREDPEIPSEYRTTLADYKGSGYSRGHLCPSADRLCSTEQNSQTFFLSNMQPQNADHNSGIWSNLENKVRNTWAPKCDTLYVVKAATIDKTNGFTTSGLIIPKYFYMALLAYKKSTNTYQAMGIWTTHTDSQNAQYITIDNLEQLTGIDFFCNLPDSIEDKVEATANVNYWNVNFTNVTIDQSVEKGSLDNPYTVGELLNDWKDGKTTIVKGFVTRVTYYNADYHELNYYIADEKGGKNELMIYGGLGLNGAQFNSKNDLPVGALVTVQGTTKTYNGTKEFNYGSKILKIETDDVNAIDAPVVTVPVRTHEVYNLQGQRVGPGYKGIVIKNGKKILVK